jgi:hypothetical protein
MHRNALALLLLWFAAGCVTPPQPFNASRPVVSFPPDALLTQRAVLTTHGRQFVLNGYLAQSATGGRRLVITGMFGQVLADVLVKPDGTVRVMRFSRLFCPAWIERYVAMDMQCIFGATENAACPVRTLSQTHFMVERRWYKLDLQIVETKPGPQPPKLFDDPHEAQK